jgi:fibronectin-binding autotransporter adhesin
MIIAVAGKDAGLRVFVRNRPQVTSSLLLAIFVASALASHSAHAAPLTWDSDGNFATGVTDGSGTWNSTNANWNNGTSDIAWVANSTAVIGSSTASTTGGTITVVGTQALDGLALASGAANYTLTGGTLNFGSNNANVNIVNDGMLTLNSALAGSGSLSFTSSNGNWDRGLVLGGDNSGFTGKMSFTQTTGPRFFVRASNGNNFGDSLGAYMADAIRFDGSILRQSGTSLAIPANRGITVGSAGVSVYAAANGTINFNSVITGAGATSFGDAATGVINLNAPNTYAGSTTIYGGRVVIGVDNALPSGLGRNVVDIRAYGGGGTAILDLNGRSVTVNALTSSYNTAGSAIDNTAAGTATLIVGDANWNGASSATTMRNTGGALSVTKIGSGLQTFSGTNSYTGATTVNAGTLVFSGSVTGASSLVVNGGTLRADLSVNPAGVFNTTSPVTLGGGTLNVQGRNTGTSSQTLGNLTLSANSASTISITPNGGAGTTLALGNTWTRNAGSSLLIDLSAAGTSTLASNPGMTNGIIGGYASVRDATSTGFATVSGGNVVRYTGATVISGTLATDTVASENYRVTAASSLNGPSATQSVNSLDLAYASGALTSSSAKTLIIGSGGLLNSAAGWRSISNLSFRSGTPELIVNIAAGEVQLYSPAGVTDGAFSTSLVKTGPGTFYMSSGSFSYTGDTIVNQGTIVGLQSAPNGTGRGNLVVNSNGTVQLGGASGAINGLSNTSETGGTVTNGWGGARVLTLGNNNATASFSGVINNGAGHDLGITKTGTGTQTFTGANTYTGATTINAGTLQIGNGGTTGSLSLSSTIANNATLVFNRSNNIAQGTDFTAAAISGSGALIKAGAGTLTLSGSNTFSGDTRISAGTLAITHASALLNSTLNLNAADAGAVTFSQSSTLGGLSGSRNFNMGGRTLSIGNNNASTTYSGILSNGALTKIGNGTLTLSGSSTYSDGTWVNGGTLTAGHASAFGTGAITLASGATLDLANLVITNAITNNGGTIRGGTINGTVSGTSNVSGGQTTFDSTIASGARIDVASTGTASFGSGAAIQAGAVIANNGVLSVSRTAASGALAFSSAVSGSGRFRLEAGIARLDAANTYTGNTVITGSGSMLKLGAAGSFANSPTIVIGDASSTGAILDLTAKSGTFAIGGSQTLKGGGTIQLASNGVLDVQGTFAPGNSPGLFTYDGGTTLLSGETIIEILGANRATLASHGTDPYYDAVNVINGGTLTFGGTLTLDIAGSYDDNTVFELFTASSGGILTGNFSSIEFAPSSLYGGLTFTSGTANPKLWTSTATSSGQSFTFDAAAGSLVIVPEPDTIIFAGIGIAMAGWSVWKRRRIARMLSKSYRA